MTRNFLATILSFAALLLSASIVSAQQQCGESADADIVIMLDKTGSISSTELTNEKNGAKTLLNFFSGATLEKPRVAIGTFNVVSGPDGRIEPNGTLTDVYGHDNPDDTGLYEVINNICCASGRTNIGDALIAAQAEITARAQANAQHYIIIVSDGIANEPGGGDGCTEGQSWTYAMDAANAAKATGTKIVTIHYGDDESCAPGTGAYFLLNYISS